MRKSRASGSASASQVSTLIALRARFAQHGRDAGLILHANRDDVDTARDPAFHDFVLLGGIEIGGPIP